MYSIIAMKLGRPEIRLVSMSIDLNAAHPLLTTSPVLENGPVIPSIFILYRGQNFANEKPLLDETATRV
jgi:hypothetical protein